MMIYLKEKFKSFKKDKDYSVTLYWFGNNRIKWAELQVYEEISLLFPKSNITSYFNQRDLDNNRYDLIVICYLSTQTRLISILKTSIKLRKFAKESIILYSLDNRIISVFKKNELKTEFRRQKLIVFLIDLFRIFPNLWRLIDRGFNVCEY